MTGRRLGAAIGGATLQQHQRLARGGVAETTHEPGTVGDAFEVRKRHRGGRVVGEEVEIVGHADCCRIAGRHRPADAHPRRPCEIEETRHEVA